LDLLEPSEYWIVLKVKSQHRTNNFRDKIRCCQCNEIIEHEFLKKNLLGFAVRISCPVAVGSLKGEMGFVHGFKTLRKNAREKLQGYCRIYIIMDIVNDCRA
jgi:hypothetical protein